MNTNTVLGVGAATAALLGAASVTSPASVLQVVAGPEQYAATALIAVAFVAYLYGIYRGGRRLKDEHDDDLVEILQALGTTVAAIAASLAVAIVWELYESVEDAYAQFLIEPVTAIMLLVTFVAVAVTYTLTRVTKRLVKYASRRVEVTPHQRELVHHVVQVVLFLCLATFIFALWEFDPTNLLLGAGVLGIVLGLAARKTLSGMLAGFVILFSRPFEVGDWIAVDEREGIVTEITVNNTEIRTFNEEHVIVPNDVLTENEVVNYSKTSRLRLETDVGVDYGDDVSAAASVAVDAMEGCESVAAAPKPDVMLDSFADSAVVLRLRYWIDRPTISLARRAQSEVVESVKRAFDDEGIKIPYPQRELSGRAEAGGLRVATDLAPESADRPAPEPVEQGDTAMAADHSTTVEEPVDRRYDDGPRDEGNGTGGRGAAGETIEGDTAGEPGDDATAGEPNDDATAGEPGDGDRPDEPGDDDEERPGDGPPDPTEPAGRRRGGPGENP